MPLGAMELGLILAIVVIIFGAGKLPEIGSALGRGIKEFKENTSETAPAVAAEAAARPQPQLQVFETRQVRADEV
jgi:sec-independent protein translocase protein TatA